MNKAKAKRALKKGAKVAGVAGLIVISYYTGKSVVITKNRSLFELKSFGFTDDLCELIKNIENQGRQAHSIVFKVPDEIMIANMGDLGKQLFKEGAHNKPYEIGVMIGID